MYVEKAKDLGDRLLPAFDSPSGLPYSVINLAKFFFFLSFFLSFFQ